MVQNDLKKSVRVGKARGQCSHKHHDYRSQTKFPHRSYPILTAPSSCQDISTQSSNPKTLYSNLPEKGHYQGNPNSSIPLFFKCFSCAKEKQFLQTSDQPFPFKCPTKCSEIQDGVCRQDCTVLDGTPMGHHCRFGRCILSCPHCMGIPQVLCLRDGRQNLCLSVHALRPVPSPMGIYQGNKTYNVTSLQVTKIHFSLPDDFLILAHLPSQLEEEGQLVM